MTASSDPTTALAIAARAGAEYRHRVANAVTTPVLPYAEMLARFAEALPETGGSGAEIIEDLVERAGGGLRAMTGPRFFGWVIGSSHSTGVAADWLTSAWGQNCANVVAAPAACAVEKVVADWLLDLLHLPRDCSVGVVSGATVANTVCLAAARGEMLRRAGWDVEADGLFGAPEITVMIGADAHATVFSGLRYLGLGANRVIEIATDALGRMRADDLAAKLEGHRGPLIVIAQAGQINTGVSDPFTEIAPLVHAAGGWLHVDGAFGLWAAASPKHRHLVAGVELADSWGTDGHKWLQTPYDGSFAIVRNEAAHRRAMSIAASYLPGAADDERDPSSYVMELSRRARGFAMWAMIKQLGRAGIAAMVEQDISVARAMAEGIGAIDGAQLIVLPELNQFMVRFGDSDDLTRATIAQIQEDAVAFIGGSEWRGQWVMRVSVCSIATTAEDGRVTVEAVRAAWEKVRAGG